MRKLGFNRKAPPSQDKKGGVAILSAAILPVLAFGGLGAIDATQMLNVGSALQDSADSAALAAVTLAAKGGNDNAASTQASSVLAADFAHVNLNAAPPAAATVVERGRETQATVTATSTVDLFFARLTGLGAPTLTRTAVAVSQPGQPICLLVLNPTADDAWSMQGTSDVRGSNCVSQVNSTSARALSRNGNATAAMKAVYVAGAAGGSQQGFSPAPEYKAPALPDPFAAKVSWPAPRACDYNNVNVTKDQTLVPGVYCGGLTVKGATAFLTPGVYVIQDGDVSVTSHGKIDGPNGVTLVLTGDASTFLVQSQGDLNLVAPTSGAWANLAIAVKPQSAQRTSTLIGGGDIRIDGVVYTPSQELHVTGGGSATASNRRILVVNTLHTLGNGQIDLSGDPAILATVRGARLIR